VTTDPEGQDGKQMMRTTFGTVTEELEPGVLLVRLSGEIDIATTEFAAEAIRAAVAPPVRLVLIDL
jgi:anti-sigma B factor antagonist